MTKNDMHIHHRHGNYRMVFSLQQTKTVFFEIDENIVNCKLLSSSYECVFVKQFEKVCGSEWVDMVCGSVLICLLRVHDIVRSDWNGLRISLD